MLKEQLGQVFRILEKKPRWVILLLLALTAVSLLGLSNFRFDASSETLILESDKSYQEYSKLGDVFDSSDFVIMSVKGKRDIFDNSELKKLQTLARNLEALPGVKSVVSILDAPIFEQPKLPLIKSAENDKYLLVDDVNLASAKLELTKSPIFKELVINKTGDLNAIQINLNETQDYSNVIQAIREVMAEETAFELLLAGPGMIVVDTINYIKGDVLIFGTLTILVFLLFLFLIFRSLWPVFIILFNATFVMLVSIGLLGLLDWPVSIVSSNFLALLLITSIAISIHILIRIQEDAKKKITISQALSNIVIPCFYTALTTIVGFASLVLSEIKPVIDFGKMMSLGVLLNFSISFLLIPVLLKLKNVTFKEQRLPTLHFFNYGYLFFKPIMKNGGTLFLLLLLPLMFYLSSQLKVENKFIDYFQKDTEIYKGLDLIDRELGGTTPLEIVLTLPEQQDDIDELDFFYSEDSDTAKYWWKKDRIDTLKSIQGRLETTYGIGKVLSLLNGIELAERLNDGPLGDLELAFIRNALLDSDDAQILLSGFLDDSEQRLRITARIIDSTPDLNRNELIIQIENMLTAELANTDIQYQVSGLGVLYNNLLQSLFSSQIRSLAFVLGVVFITLLILFRSIFTSLAVLMVPVCSVGVILSIMSALNIPLDIMTITIAAISVGMSVDYGIHFAWRLKEEMKSNNLKKFDAQLLGKTVQYSSFEKETFLTTGKAIIITGATIIVGFFVFLFSNFNPTILFGIFSATAIFVSVVVTFTFLPNAMMLKSK